MSDDVYIRYAYDPTGVNPDNAVWNEPHVLSQRQFRAFAPKHGPFYVDSIVVVDRLTGQQLVRKTQTNPVGDYSVPMINQEMTLKLAKEVSDAVLIENENISDNILVSYQAVGGPAQRQIDNIVNMYEAFVNDTRMVDFVTGVFGKPLEYPPGPHPHYLTEVFGFEALTFVFERIRDAILMGNTPAYEMLYEAVRKNYATKSDIDQGLINNHALPLDVLQYATQRYNFNTIKMTPIEGFAKNGKRTRVEVVCSNAPRIDKLYWTIEHITTKHSDFVANSGSFDLIKGQGNFYVETALNKYVEGDEQFRIELRRGGPDRYVVFTSYEFTIPAHTSLYRDRIVDAMKQGCMASPMVSRRPKIQSINAGVWRSIQC